MCYQDMKVVREQRDNALREVEELRRQRDAAIAALEMVEFAVEYRSRLDGHIYYQCPKCGEEKPDHRPGCQLATALALAKAKAQ